MLCTAWPHVSPVAFAGVRAIVGRRAGIMRGSWHGPARTCVRRGDTDAWPSIPSAPRLGLARSALANRGLCSTAILCRQWRAVQCRAGGPLRRTHRVIACFADRPGAVASAAEYVSSFVAAQAGRHRSRPSVVGRRPTSLGYLGGGRSIGPRTRTACWWEVLNKHLILSDLASQVYWCYWVRIDPTNPHHHECLKNHQLSSCICVLNSHCIL